jgi:hypothetical protein
MKSGGLFTKKEHYGGLVQQRQMEITVHCKPGPDLDSQLTQEVESGSTESNMRQLGCIQVRKSKETRKYKCASCGAYLTQLSYILPSGVK